ncbi:hypothetical protein CVT25_000973 [Psilocybe cyanescens]|uniref:Uncharacterized protein n=1 Tax=Psilocybe cyanescens TaxID=93625 RepID=A0A409XMB4_PSICY|nr:hypothetical protein CVT25_000973 [Psilocybe cyanescens]
MAAPVHYIRTIQTSFTAAHPHSSSAAAWATASASSQYLNQFNHHHHHYNNNSNIISQPRAPGAHGGYTSISTHNTHMYTHHLRDLAHSSVSGPRQQSPLPSAQPGPYIPQGHRKSITASADASPTPVRSAPSAPRSRRRSVSIRMPPTYKFDPFADEPIAPEPQMASSPSPAAVQTETAELDAPQPLIHTREAPYTIQIPAAAQTDIQLYTPAPSPRSPSPSYTSRALSPRAQSFTPMQMQMPKAPPPNLSKVVASILLNRVHAVGKPMRRRVAPSPAARGQGRDYVKSCLSSVISVEA